MHGFSIENEEFEWNRSFLIFQTNSPSLRAIPQSIKTHCTTRSIPSRCPFALSSQLERSKDNESRKKKLHNKKKRCVAFII